MSIKESPNPEYDRGFSNGWDAARAQPAQAGRIDEIRDALQNGDVIERATEAQRVVLAQAVPASCGECGKKTSDGWALYCVACMEKAGLPGGTSSPPLTHSCTSSLVRTADSTAQAVHDGLVWREIERGANYIKMEGRFSDRPAQPLTTSENGKAPAQGASAITSRSAQAVPLLSDEDVRAAGGIMHSDGNIFFTSIDKLNAAVRAKLGVAVPMTDEQIDAMATACKYTFHATMIDHRALARAIEKAHGIVGKEGGNV